MNDLVVKSHICGLLDRQAGRFDSYSWAERKFYRLKGRKIANQ